MRLEITCENRVGIVREIMFIFSEQHINVTFGEIGGETGDKVYLSAPELLSIQYRAIEKSLYHVSGVKKLRRILLIPSERRHFELETLLRHVTDPVLSVAQDGRIVAANPATARAFGVNLSQLSGLQLQRFLPRLPLMELLQGFTKTRYGLVASLRGRSYRLNWSPITLTELPGSVKNFQKEVDKSLIINVSDTGSIVGAVLTLQPEPLSGLRVELPAAKVLWDFDQRRQSCLRLHAMAPTASPLLIIGEQGSGKSSFANAAYYLSPNASKNNFYCLRPQNGELNWPENFFNSSAYITLIIENLHLLSDTAQLKLTRKLLRTPELRNPNLRLIATSLNETVLIPALAQFFSTLILQLPPLRTMRPAMQQFATAMLNEHLQGETIDLNAETVEVLCGHDWPNNFTGLRDYLTVALAHCRERKGKSIMRQDLPELAAQACLPWQEWSRGLNYRQIMEHMERALLTEMMIDQPSTRELSRQLGISHTSIANKLRKYGLEKRPNKTNNRK
ncbi:MAG: PAS domain-containing protein [Gammaproteobacteria bacterium]|nr:PAS domain-containing protein [Gammaproteobacteria bacterium]